MIDSPGAAQHNARFGTETHGFWSGAQPEETAQAPATARLARRRQKAAEQADRPAAASSRLDGSGLCCTAGTMTAADTWTSPLRSVGPLSGLLIGVEPGRVTE